MGLKVGIVGVGSFAQCFIPLFKAHPLVEEVVLCDVDAAKLAHNAETHGIKRTLPSLDALCDSDVDAAVIITQNWLHAPQAVQALRAGKHVYSAVPAGVTVAEIGELVRTVEQTGRIYMMGETSYYRPGAIYCRQRLAEGAFGDIVYAQAEYYHDFDHGLYDVMKKRAGERWLEFAGSPPMLYPTHSTGYVIAVTAAHATHVSCQGFVDTVEDQVFRKDTNLWGNTFSNETALFRMSDGSTCRINEFRRIGHPSVERMSLYGTQGCFEQSCAGAMWLAKDEGQCVRLDDLLRCKELPVGPGASAADPATCYRDVSDIHPLDRLPLTFRGLTNGHGGSHQFLADDFVRACVTGERPPVNVWQAARFTVPGIVAHESALRGGALLEVPDFGDPPSN